MPNWCDNLVMIKGSKEEVLTVKEMLTKAGNVFSFDKVLPCPPALLNASAPNRGEQSIAFNTTKYGAKDWYDWCNENWGTKWDSSDSILTVELGNDEEYQLSYSFQTAWAPPVPVYQVLAEKFPNINIFINYDESGMGFSGWRYYNNGSLVKEAEYSESYYERRTFMEPSTDVWEYLE